MLESDNILDRRYRVTGVVKREFRRVRYRGIDLDSNKEVAITEINIEALTVRQISDLLNQLFRWKTLKSDIVIPVDAIHKIGDKVYIVTPWRGLSDKPSPQAVITFTEKLLKAREDHYDDIHPVNLANIAFDDFGRPYLKDLYSFETDTHNRHLGEISFIADAFVHMIYASYEEQPSGKQAGKYGNLPDPRLVQKRFRKILSNKATRRDFFDAIESASLPDIMRVSSPFMMLNRLREDNAFAPLNLFFSTISYQPQFSLQVSVSILVVSIFLLIALAISSVSTIQRVFDLLWLPSATVQPAEIVLTAAMMETQSAALDLTETAVTIFTDTPTSLVPVTETNTPTVTITQIPPYYFEIVKLYEVKPNDVLGEILVSYPLWLRPGNSDQVKILIQLPQEVQDALVASATRVDIPATATPIVGKSEVQRSNIVIDNRIRVELASITLDVQPRTELIQDVNIQDVGQPSEWIFSIKAPADMGYHLLDVSVFLDENSDSPSWIGSYQIEVLEPTSTPQPTSAPTFTATLPASPTPIPTPTPTPSFCESIIIQIRDEPMDGISWLLGGLGMIALGFWKLVLPNLQRKDSIKRLEAELKILKRRGAPKDVRYDMEEKIVRLRSIRWWEFWRETDIKDDK